MENGNKKKGGGGGGRIQKIILIFLKCENKMV